MKTSYMWSVQPVGTYSSTGGGAGTLEEAIKKGSESACWYTGACESGYQTAQLTVTEQCAVCSGAGEVPKKGRVLFATAAIQKASGDGQLRFSLRQLYYALRPYVLEQSTEKGDLSYEYFASWVGRHEATFGEIEGMYRDTRGTLYHPHTRETIPIGTISVEQYRRPAWTFRQVLYIEKEGLFEVLKQAKFPERYDCALLSSKGFASRAGRDLLDLLGDDGEEINLFCIHDADGPGSLIHQTLAEGTVARGARRVKVINLGLEPWEAVRMGLQIEEFEPRKKKVPVARYIRARGEQESAPGGDSWETWLQTHRVELNAMSSPQFLVWLEEKFEWQGVKKIVPPEDVLRKELEATIEQQVRGQIQAELLQEAGFEKLVAKRIKRLSMAMEDVDLTSTVEGELELERGSRWNSPITKMAHRITDGE